MLNILDRMQKKQGLISAAGNMRIHEQVFTLDIVKGPYVDYVSDAHSLPFNDDSFDVVLAQESLEHFENPFRAVNEIYRVLRPNGIFFIHAQFVIGHSGPTDFWRFSKEGIQQLVEQAVEQAGFDCEYVGMSVGPATGFYRILVEFFATIFALVFKKSSLPAKAFLAFLFYPIKKEPGVNEIATV